VTSSKRYSRQLDSLPGLFEASARPGGMQSAMSDFPRTTAGGTRLRFGVLGAAKIAPDALIYLAAGMRPRGE
jgi:hypothetical protein